MLLIGESPSVSKLFPLKVVFIVNLKNLKKVSFL